MLLGSSEWWSAHEAEDFSGEINIANTMMGIINYIIANIAIMEMSWCPVYIFAYFYFDNLMVRMV